MKFSIELNLRAKPKYEISLHYRGKTPPNECPVYDTKPSDGEIPVMVGLWGMQSTPSFPLLPGPLWPRMVAPDRALSMG